MKKMRSSLETDATSCVGGQRKKRFPSRWSLRHLIYSSPILNRRRSQNASGSSKVQRTHSGVTSEVKIDGPSKEMERGGPHYVEIHQATSKTSVYTSSTKSTEGTSSMECPLCLTEVSAEQLWDAMTCGHRACIACLQQYLRVEITESRVCISCPICSEPMHPNEIRRIICDTSLYEKYEDFMVRRVLAIEPDSRWCPAPDCGFAVIASECASCPKLKCMRPGCDSYFCYHCKAEWHPNQTCDAARAQRSPNIRSSSITHSQDSPFKDDIKPCPRCQVLIVKMDDGSCNHMVCAVCGAEFCWLCMKEISDLHYLSPSGCTFWGKKPWSRKKKILWQLGTLIGAPVGIALVAGITVPAMIIGIPVWVGRKLYTRYKTANKHRRNAAIVGGVMASVMISPILAGLAVGIGVPILLFYVYGVVPVSLCRSGGCGGSPTSDDSTIMTNRTGDASSVDVVSSKIGNPSIGETSLSLVSGSQLLRETDRDSSSTVALAGSVGPVNHRSEETQPDSSSTRRLSINSLSESAIVSIGDDGAASMRALAGSVLNYKASGSDSCSCVTAEDYSSERVRFDDNVNYISTQAEKLSIGSSCSFRVKCSMKSALTKTERAPDTLSNESITIDIMNVDEKPKKSQTAILRHQFFSTSHNDNDLIKSTLKNDEDHRIMEDSHEILLDNKLSLPKKKSNEDLSVQLSSFVVEISKL